MVCVVVRSKRGTPIRFYLVGAPAGKVNVPVVQLQWHVAHGMGQVPADVGALRVGGRRDRLDVKELARVKLHARKHDHGHALAVFLNLLDNVLGAQGVLPRARADEDDGVRGVEAVLLDDALKRVLIIVTN